MLKAVYWIPLILAGLSFSYGQDSVMVTALKANLRSTPDANGVIVTTVGQNESFELLLKRGTWFLVQAPKYVGWIHGNSIRILRKNPAKSFDRWGDPNASFRELSKGPGSGGGMGSSQGTGQGSGRGTGTGSGTGSGSGSYYPGSNIVDDSNKYLAITPYKIISKPAAVYTKSARAHQVQGSVRLKVTLLASGAVGSITPVTRLPHGLTEQAIAAARQIRFQPKKVNGVAQSVVVTIDYGFNIY